jgi:hypothetical protein
MVRKWTRKIVIAAGVIPVIRLAWPSVSGFDLANISITSRERPGIFDN